MDSTRETVSRGFVIPVVVTLDPANPEVQRWLASTEAEQQAVLRRTVATVIDAVGARGSFFSMHVPPHAYAPTWDDPLEHLLADGQQVTDPGSTPQPVPPQEAPMDSTTPEDHGTIEVDLPEHPTPDEVAAQAMADVRLGFQSKTLNSPERRRAIEAVAAVSIDQASDFLVRYPTPGSLPGGPCDHDADQHNVLGHAVGDVLKPLASWTSSLAVMNLVEAMTGGHLPEGIAEKAAEVERASREGIRRGLGQYGDDLVYQVADLIVPGWREQ